MTTNAEFDINRDGPARIIVLSCHVARYRLVHMDYPTDSVPGSYPNGMESSLPDERLQRLYGGIDEGFERVLRRLAEIDKHLDNVPSKTAEILASQREFLNAEDGAKAGNSTVSPIPQRSSMMLI
jgi:hypothetical protein